MKYTKQNIWFNKCMILSAIIFMTLPNALCMESKASAPKQQLYKVCREALDLVADLGDLDLTTEAKTKQNEATELERESLRDKDAFFISEINKQLYETRISDLREKAKKLETLDKKLGEVLAETSSLSEFKKSVATENCVQRLMAILTALVCDAENGKDGFLANRYINRAGNKVEGWKNFKDVLLHTYSKLLSAEQVNVGGMLIELFNGISTNKQAIFLLSSCFRILCEYYANKRCNSLDKQDASTDEMLRSAYFYCLIMNHDSLKEQQASGLLNLKTISEKVPLEEFDSNEDFIDFIENNFHISSESSLKLDKKDLRTLIFKLGFIFYAYEHNFVKLREKSGDNQSFYRNLLTFILKIQNNIESKIEDKDELRSLFDDVLVIGISHHIFYDEERIPSFDDYVSQSSEIISNKTMQIMFLLLVKKNFLECQRNAHNTKERIKSFLFGLGTASIVAIFAVICIFPPAALPALGAGGAIVALLSGASSAATILTAGPGWDAAKTLITRQPEVELLNEIKYQFLRFSNNLITSIRETNVKQADQLSKETLIFGSRESWHSGLSSDQISKNLTALISKSVAAHSKKGTDSEEFTSSFLTSKIKELERRIERLEAIAKL